MADNLSEQIEMLYSKNNTLAYQVLKELQRKSEETDEVYGYIDKFSEMLDSTHSYVRTRALVLIAANSRWDVNYKVDESIDKYLKHITDSKPITARQCIKMLPIIAHYKPELKDDIVSALQKADISIYANSMQPLVYKDIKTALYEIQKE